ncbi:MAG TPA: hypothetical protein VMY99_01100 [Nevskiaceae bacterium]|nr:hypothetical protein [Nevskiaceae bacterium]
MGEQLGPSGEYEQQIIAERCLAEVDNLNRLRGADGRHDPAMLEAIHVNLITAAKEAAMPYAISTTYQEHREGTFWWLDQTPVEVAESGYIFHQSPAAHARVAVEVEEARHTQQNLRPGYIGVFISPRMTRQDAPYEVAKTEHLADDDQVRIHMLDVDEQGAIQGKYVQSLLVRDVPLSAWAAMSRDPDNIFGKALDIEDEGSALSVMKLYDKMELPAQALPNGVVDIVKAVVPYIDDQNTRQKVESQIILFHGGQEAMHEAAVSVADRWLDFEVALADSLEAGEATPVIQRFIAQLQHEWGRQTRALLDVNRLPEGGWGMTRELAIKLEEARRNTTWTSAAVAAGNEDVIAQLGYDTAKVIYENELFIQTIRHNGASAQEIAAIEAQSNRLIAQKKTNVGGGCSGDARGDFESSEQDDGGTSYEPNQDSSKEKDKKNWRWKRGICQVKTCPTRPGQTKVGPCSVCVRCQGMFDKGSDPTKWGMPSKDREQKPEPKKVATVRAVSAAATRGEVALAA